MSRDQVIHTPEEIARIRLAAAVIENIDSGGKEHENDKRLYAAPHHLHRHP